MATAFQTRMSFEPFRIASALREFAGAYRWDHLVTLTSKKSNTTYALAKEFEQGFIRRLAGKCGRYVSWLCVFEPTHAAQWHAHAILAGTAGLPLDMIGWAWRWGRIRSDRIYSPAGAIGYITKHTDALTAAGAEIVFDLSARLVTHDGELIDRRRR